MLLIVWVSTMVMKKISWCISNHPYPLLFHASLFSAWVVKILRQTATLPKAKSQKWRDGWCVFLYNIIGIIGQFLIKISVCSGTSSSLPPHTIDNNEWRLPLEQDWVIVSRRQFPITTEAQWQSDPIKVRHQTTEAVISRDQDEAESLKPCFDRAGKCSDQTFTVWWIWI